MCSVVSLHFSPSPPGVHSPSKQSFKLKYCVFRSIIFLEEIFWQIRQQGQEIMPKLLRTLSALLRKLLTNFGLVSKTLWLKTFYRGNFTLWLPWKPVFLYLGDVFDLPVAQRVEPRFLVFSPVELHYGIVKGRNWIQFPVQLRNCYWLSDSVPKALL